MQGQHWLIKDSRQLEEFFLPDLKERLKKGPVAIKMEEGKKAYTTAQHAAIWVFCDHVAYHLAGHGVTLRSLVGSMKNAEIELGREAIKYLMWQPIQEALFKTTSLSQLKADQVSRIYDHINRFLVEQHGIHVPFPSKEGRI